MNRAATKAIDNLSAALARAYFRAPASCSDETFQKLVEEELGVEPGWLDRMPSR